ncbi:radical SAM/SPASM domain-containing protein [Paraburkholderia sp. BR14263]|uniref:radical SAM/SPASM domain-containing protein n=1 Tax=unclassified Paraburkholderia TaxID=2615204 RepID=UPI0034CED1B8
MDDSITGGQLPIFQIHPSLRCNLSCKHCYSNSGPTADMTLDVALVCEAVSDAASLGYRVVSVSGGEPMLYRGLGELLGHSKSIGMLTTVTTNGFFLDRERLDSLRDRVDLLAISLDGPPALHNAMRGSTRAFQRMAAGLVNVRRAGIRFGFIHTLTRYTWEHLLWVAEFAARNNAILLQIHPLELSGRAVETMPGDPPAFDVAGRAYLIAMALLHKYGDCMAIQIDLLHRNTVLERPELVFASDVVNSGGDTSASMLRAIVLQSNGTIVPVSHGINRRYEICNVHEQRLADAWPSYLTQGHHQFVKLCKREFDAIREGAHAPLFNWHERIVARSNDIKDLLCSTECLHPSPDRQCASEPSLR